MVDDMMIVAELRQAGVGAKAVGQDAGAGLHGPFDEGLQLVPGDVGHTAQTHTAKALLIDDLYSGSHDRLLPGRIRNREFTY